MHLSARNSDNAQSQGERQRQRAIHVLNSELGLCITLNACPHKQVQCVLSNHVSLDK